ncbi:MAG: SPFH domain-containing protein [Myxococcota bacterium]
MVQYKIDNAKKYLFSFRDIETTLRLMAEATMRTVVGDCTIDEVMTGGREIENEAKRALIALNELRHGGCYPTAQTSGH